MWILIVAVVCFALGWADALWGWHRANRAIRECLEGWREANDINKELVAALKATSAANLRLTQRRETERAS